VAQHLLKGSFIYCSRQVRISAEALALPDWARLKQHYPPGSWSETSFRQIQADQHIRPYTGKVVVLIDEGCFSATDNLLACLADLHPNVVFVGRPSGGGTGAPYEIATLTHSKAVLTLCTMRIWSPHGRQIEGRGTQPSVAIRPSRADLLAGRDADLAAALEQAKNQSKPSVSTDLNKEGKG
jgi:C-terminal processing protease CtpA/Prc